MCISAKSEQSGAPGNECAIESMRCGSALCLVSPMLDQRIGSVNIYGSNVIGSTLWVNRH